MIIDVKKENINFGEKIGNKNKFDLKKIILKDDREWQKNKVPKQRTSNIRRQPEIEFDEMNFDDPHFKDAYKKLLWWKSKS